MSVVLTKSGTVTFSRGSKPPSIKDAQRQVRRAYEHISKLDPEQVPALVRAAYFKHVAKASPTEIYAIDPVHQHVVESAIAVYCKLGASLLKFSSMYSMDLMVPTSALGMYPDLDLTSFASLDPRLSQVRFLAREI